MSESKPQKQHGKGSKRRVEDFKAVQSNWEDIPNFGFKPKWAIKLENKQEKVNLYPHHLTELMVALTCDKELEKKMCYVTDACKVKDFDLHNAFEMPTVQLKKLLKKYNLDNSCKDMYIWEVIEKMHSFRPF